MADESATWTMLEQLMKEAGLKVSGEDLNVVSRLHDSFAGQRSRLAGAARADVEPMIIPAFDRVAASLEPADDRVS